MNSLRFTDRLPARLPVDPMPLADAWLKEATGSAGARNPNSMTLATVSKDGQPSARVVLCKQFVPDPGYLVFYTNYRSRKGLDIDGNAKVAVAFYWDSLGLQVRLEGTAVRSPGAESDAYFASRDRGSQLGAWGSDQSRPIPSRDALVAQIAERAGQLGISLEPATQPVGDAAPPIRRRRTGAASASGPAPSSCGSRAKIAFTIAPRGGATWFVPTNIPSPHLPGRERGCNRNPMRAELVESRIRCPWCNEAMEVVLDLSAGSQSYIEDCQVCCQPMQLEYEVDEGSLHALQVGRA